MSRDAAERDKGQKPQHAIDCTAHLPCMVVFLPLEIPGVVAVLTLVERLAQPDVHRGSPNHVCGNLLAQTREAQGLRRKQRRRISWWGPTEIRAGQVSELLGHCCE